MAARAETHLQPSADLPKSITPLWMVLQPAKTHEGTFRVPEYSLLEQQFWATSVILMDNELTMRADSHVSTTPDVDVHRVIYGGASLPHHMAINALIHHELEANPSSLYVGFTHGILPDLAALYNNPQLRPETRTRMHTAIVGGSHGNDIKATRVLTALPEEEVKNASLIVAHDDVADTVAALAAFVDQIRAIRTDTPADFTFVDRFVDKQLNEMERAAIYSRLAHLMRELNVVAAVAVYKNRQFATILHSVAMEQTGDPPNARWQELQLNLLSWRLEYDQSLWLMGDGMDTDIPIRTIFDLIPPEIRSHPAVAPLFAHTMRSKLRIGSTIHGLIGLTQYEDKDRAMRDLTVWAASRLTHYLSRFAETEEATALRN